MKISRVSYVLAALAAVTCVAVCLGGKLPVKSPWEIIGKANLSNAVEKRVGIILQAIEGTIAPIPNLPKEIWQSPYKTASYYCRNSSLEGMVPDGLEAIIDYSAGNERWPDQVPCKMSAGDMARRSAVIEHLRSPKVIKIVVEGVVKGAVGTTPDKTAKNRKKVLDMLDTAHAYLDTFDMKAEDAWLAECKQATAKAVEADKKNDSNESYFAVQYRFNQFGPGKYKEGAVPSDERYIETFVYRRLKDGMTKNELRAIIFNVRRALRSEF